MKLLTKVVLTAAILGFAAVSSANLIINGSFEDSNVKNNQWKWFTSDQVNGWEGSTIEVWDSLQNFDSFHGDQHAELNAHGNNGQVFSIFQSFNTLAGNSYDFSFAYAARTNKNEQFSYSILSGNNIIDTAIIDNNLVKTWSLFESDFTAIDTTTSIMFTSIRPSTGTVGNFLDAVSVTPSLQTSTVNASAPASALFMVLGVFALALIQRKAK